MLHLHTFEDILLHVTALILDRPTPDGTLFRIEKNLYADIDIDSDGHIQVQTYQTKLCAEACENSNGGGICTLWNDAEYSDPTEDPESIDVIRENSTPEQLAETIKQKALFVWELVHAS